MPSTLYLLIFKILLQNENAVNSAILAKKCNVSVKTINNSMPLVRKTAEEYDLNFVAIRGKGYLIDNDMSLKSAIKSRINDEPPVFYEQDRLLYILHCLLNRDESCRIKNLEYTLHLTRPSIYKLLDKIEIWLNPLNIQLERSRKNGLRILCGEKRHRLAAAQWYNETIRYLKIQPVDYSDALHLKASLNTYLQTYQKEVFNSFIREIQTRYDFEFLKYDLEQIAIMLHISIERIISNHTVSFPNNYVDLIKKVGLESYVHEIESIIETRFDLKLPEAEAYYLFSIIFSSETYNDKKMIQQQKERIQINAELKKQILELVKDTFISDEEQNALLDDIESSLKNEIIYQVKKAVPNASEFCERVQMRYPQEFIKANAIYSLIQEYYPLKYVLKFHCLLTMILAYRSEKAKQQVSIALVYNCGNAEKNYMLYMLEKYVPDGKVTHVCHYNSLMAQECLQTDCDLMISTLVLTQINDYLLLPLTFSFEDLQYVEKKVHQLYLEKNQ